MPRTRPSTAEKRASFRAMHEKGCFVLPNPWDIGSARLLEHAGFAALASTSSGAAWTQGRPDYGSTREDVLAHLTELSAAVDLPINADFESGFAHEPEGVAESVRLAIDTGIAGLSIEDRDSRQSEGGLYDLKLAIERIRAARHAIDASGTGVILVARTEGLLADKTAVMPAIERLVAFAEAGADCLYAPGMLQKEDLAAMVRAVSPKPLNALSLNPALTFAELQDIGVRRISVGGALARVAWGAFLAAVDQIKNGSFAVLANGTSSAKLNGMFGEKS